MALLLFLSLDRAQTLIHCNAVAEGKSANFSPERNNVVPGVVADVRAAAERDAGAAAPVLENRHLIQPEFGLVMKDIADAAEPQSGGAADVLAGGHMEHRPVDPVELLAQILDQQVDAGEVRLERSPEH